MTLLELFEKYARKRLRGKSENTLRLYRHTIRNFGKTLGREPTINDLDGDTVEEHLWRVVKRGRSPATANKDRSQIIALWRWAAEQGLVKTFPSVQAIPEPEQVPLGWMPWEVEALLVSAARETVAVGEVRGSIWWQAMLRVILDTGERIGAVRQLPRTALQSGYLLIAADTRKGKTRDKLHQLERDTVEAIERLLGKHTEPNLFPWPYCETYLYNRFNAILDRAGLPTDRKSKFHRIRKTVASAVARAGGDPTKAMDHASPKTTRKYLDPRIVGGVDVSKIVAAYLADPELRKKSQERRDAV